MRRGDLLLTARNRIECRKTTVLTVAFTPALRRAVWRPLDRHTTAVAHTMRCRLRAGRDLHRHQPQRRCSGAASIGVPGKHVGVPTWPPFSIAFRSSSAHCPASARVSNRRPLTNSPFAQYLRFNADGAVILQLARPRGMILTEFP